MVGRKLLDRVAAQNADSAVHSVLVQLPLPAHIRELHVIHAIAPEKDVNGFTPVPGGVGPMACAMLMQNTVKTRACKAGWL